MQAPAAHWLPGPQPCPSGALLHAPADAVGLQIMHALLGSRVPAAYVCPPMVQLVGPPELVLDMADVLVVVDPVVAVDVIGPVLLVTVELPVLVLPTVPPEPL